jgi:hypothetical protein
MALAPPPACTPAYTVNIEVKVNVTKNPPPVYTYAFFAEDGFTSHYLTNQNGDLDFHLLGQPVEIIFDLTGNSGLKFDHPPDQKAFSFAWDYVSGASNPLKQPIDDQHYEIRKVIATDTKLTACYFNTQVYPANGHLSHPTSQYGLNFLQPDGQPWSIDPGVGNGTNKMHRRPNPWRHYHWRRYHRSWLRHHHHHRRY